MSLRFAKEPLELVLDEALPLFKAHWRETEMYRAGNEFDPDYQRYIEFNRTEFLQFYTVRDDAGKLVGDAAMYVTVGMHDRKKIAIEDTWFLLPEVRGGMAAVRFLDFVERDLLAQGVQEVYMTTKLANRAGGLLEARGYAHVANQYWKQLCAHHQPRPHPTTQLRPPNRV